MARALVKPRRELDEIEQKVVQQTLRSLDRKPTVTVNYRTLTEDEIDDIMRRPAVIAAIQARVKRRIRTELVPAALEVLHQAMSNEGVSWRERISAAKAVIDHSGIGREEGSGEDKSLADMSPQEIMSFAQAAREELATRAQATGESEASEGEATHPSYPLRSLQAQESGGKPQKRQLRGSKKDSIFD